MNVQTSNAESWRPVVQLALVFAAIKFAVEFIGNLLAQHFGYGIFRDEMYYIVCGRHLAWGYVDQAPMVALQARIAELLFGFHHLALFRSFSALAGAAKVFLTGILVWQLGGRRIAQAMAMIAVLIAPAYLAIDSFLSMNSFEPVFWMGCTVVVLSIVNGSSPKWWVLFGIIAGLGLLNKPSIVFFLVALLIGLLPTAQRRILWSRWTLAAVGLIVLISLPYLIWQIHHQWPTLVWLNNVNHSHKNVKLGPLAFLGAQLMMLNNISILLLLPGLIWLLFAKAACRFRCTGLAESFFSFAKNSMAAASLVHCDGHPRRDHAAYGNSSHAAVHMDSLHACATHDQPEYGDGKNRSPAPVLCRPIWLARTRGRSRADLQFVDACRSGQGGNLLQQLWRGWRHRFVRTEVWPSTGNQRSSELLFLGTAWLLRRPVDCRW